MFRVLITAAVLLTAAAPARAVTLTPNGAAAKPSRLVAARTASQAEARRVALAYVRRDQQEGYTLRYRVGPCRGHLRHTPRSIPFSDVHAYCRIHQWFDDAELGRVRVDQLFVVDRYPCYLDGWAALSLTDDYGVPEREVKLPLGC